MLKLAFRKQDKELSDEALVAGCLEENRAMQNLLFKRYAPLMLGVCCRYVQPQEEAEDVMQDGFVRVFNSLKHFRGESSLRTWMTRIMVNTAISYFHKNTKFRNEHDITLADESASTAIFQVHQLDTGKLMECVRQLPDGYRVVFNMFAIEGFTHKEIADCLNISESSSRSQYVRARQALEKKISELYTDKPEYGRRSAK